MGQGWDACEDELRLTGWTQRRRVIVMRRVRKSGLVVETKRPARKSKDQVQTELRFIDENEPVKSWEYAVLVCNAHYETLNIGQLYRNRADCRICKVSGCSVRQGV